jgi:S-adenosylmethionine/arginine decarboxylase-like enzyme
VGLGYVPHRSPLAAPVGEPLGFCQVAAVLEVAVSTWPELGAVAAEVTMLVVADFSAADVATEGLGYDPLRSPPAAPVGDEPAKSCHEALEPFIAVSTWPVVGAAAVAIATVVVAVFSPRACVTVGFG